MPDEQRPSASTATPSPALAGGGGFASAPLRGRVVLVVEDEYFQAADLRVALAAGGATVIGPAATLDKGLALLNAAPRVDLAVIDVDLRGAAVFPLADELARRALPFVFVTGYDAAAIPERFAGVTRCVKPVRIAALLAALERGAPA